MIGNKAQQFLSGRVGREGNPSERIGEEGGGDLRNVYDIFNLHYLQTGIHYCKGILQQCCNWIVRKISESKTYSDEW